MSQGTPEAEFNAGHEEVQDACKSQMVVDGGCLQPGDHGGHLPRPLGSPFVPGAGNGGSSSGPRRQPKDGLSGSEHDSIRQLSFPLWCSKLTTLVLRSRTAFASYLSFSISTSRRSSTRAPKSPALFPVPPPVDGCFDRMPAGVSSCRRRAIGIARAVHIVCMALNFWQSNGDFSGKEALWRAPNSVHRALYQRVRAFIKSDGLMSTFDALHVGRKNPELFARLSEVTALLTKLGCSASPYSKVFTGYEITKDNTQFPELEPYRDLDPSRLLLFGRGHWDVTDFLGDDLVMAYREPESIKVERTPAAWEYPRIRDSAEKVAQLALLWDRQGLLRLHQERVSSRKQYELVRIFNCYKAVDRDRQIGDRRGRNAVECILRGPSSNLPAGPDLCDLAIDLDSQRLHVSISDRRDFYNQLWATKARAVSNTLGPGLPVSLVKETDAYQQFLLDSSRKRYSRVRHGDRLGFAASSSSVTDIVWACFNSVLQGDHGGVEIATDAHTRLLQSYGLLQEHVRMVANKPCFSFDVAEGLVIDDFFCVSIDPRGQAREDSHAYAAYYRAQQAYKDFELLGSPEKDIVAGEEGKTIGAYLNGGASAVAHVVCTVGAPPAKRLALSTLTLQSCALAYTTVSLHRCIVGAWVSMLLYRRPMMNILNESFSLIEAFPDLDDGALIPLPRAVAQELTLCAVLAPLMLSDVAVPFDDLVYATDASEERGAVCSAFLGRQLGHLISKVCKTKGAYTRLHVGLGSQGTQIEPEVNEGEPEHDSLYREVDRPLVFSFEFLEIFAGSSRISEALHRIGVVVGPPIDISYSEEFDLSKLHVLAWIYHLIEAGRLLAVAVEPPCTTFSIMRRPALRSRAQPYGFDVQDPQTRLGNLLFLRALQILKKASLHGVAGLLERPFSALSKFLPPYQHALRWPGADEVRVDSCQYGSIHQKSFALLVVNVDLSSVARRCQGTCCHVPIAGVYTKASAIYTEELAAALAWALRHSIRVIKARREAEQAGSVEGLENQLVNEVMLANDWKVTHSWKFKKPSHINLLELKAVEKLIDEKAKSGPSRFLNLVDSNVSRCALGKGRSASWAITSVLRRISAAMVAFGLYMVNPFCPTRLNCADDPTRLRELRRPVDGWGWRERSFEELWRIALIRPTKRWASNWIRLIIFLLGPTVVDLADKSLYRHSPQGQGIFQTSSSSVFPCPAFHYAPLDFDSSLGFPGEGPCPSVMPHAAQAWSWPFTSVPPSRRHLGFSLHPQWTSCRSRHLDFLRLLRCLRCFLAPLLLLSCLARCDAMAPETAAEIARAAERLNLEVSLEGRPTLPVTNRYREKCWTQFEMWLRTENIDFESLLARHVEYIDDINAVVARFGRSLFSAGKPYNQFVETINTLTSKKPALRRLMQGAWDGFFLAPCGAWSSPCGYALAGFTVDDHSILVLGLDILCWMPCTELGSTSPPWRTACGLQVRAAVAERC